MLVLIFVTLMSYFQGGVKGFNRVANLVIPIFLIFYIGTRPISSVFIDMTTYAQSFEIAATRGDVYYTDYIFSGLMLGLSRVTTVEVFFFVCAVFYILPIISGLKHRHGNFAFGALIATITSFSFFTYGVNGIRNGMATSILFAAIAWSDRKMVFLLLAAVAYGTHNSVALPALFYFLTYFNSNLFLYGCLWVSTLLFTAATSGSSATFLAGLLSSSEDSRVGYLTAKGDDKGGFRLDFVLYSILPVLISYAWANTRTRQDPFYRRLLCCYLGTNSFWLLVMYASFSNRFAYLSWFMMPWLIVYPFIPNQKSEKDYGSRKIEINQFAAMIIGQFTLTYLFDIIIYPNR